MRKRDVFLVTGGGGLLGSWLVPLLRKRLPDHDIFMVSRNPECNLIYERMGINVIHGDLADGKLWSRLPKDITHVFYLAAVIPWCTEDKCKAEIAGHNLIPLAHFMEQASNWPRLQQVIFSSSVSVYRPTGRTLHEASEKCPGDLYGVSKLLSENLLLTLKSRGVRSVFLRYSSLYARGQFPGTVLPTMIRSALENGVIQVYGDGRRVQDFLYCEDAARANWQAYRTNAEGAFNIGTGISTSMSELAGRISKVFTKGKAKIAYVPEKADESCSSIRLDIRKAKRELKFRPLIPLERGLRMLEKEMETESWNAK